MEEQKGHNYNSKFIQNLLENPKNNNQLVVVESWPRMVNRILSCVEMALGEGKQCLQVKRSLNTIIYEVRNNMLLYFNDNEMDIGIDSSVEFIQNEFAYMLDKVNEVLNMVFTVRLQRISVGNSIGEVVKDVLGVMEQELCNK